MSSFCLERSGFGEHRKSQVDALTLGCIPVLFSPHLDEQLCVSGIRTGGVWSGVFTPNRIELCPLCPCSESHPPLQLHTLIRQMASAQARPNVAGGLCTGALSGGAIPVSSLTGMLSSAAVWTCGMHCWRSPKSASAGCRRR